MAIHPDSLGGVTQNVAGGGSGIPSRHVTFKIWRNAGNRLLRDAGIEFYERYPEDIRRWTWFAATAERPVTYGATPDDSLAALEWAKRFPVMRAAFLASPEATIYAKATLEFRELYANVRAAQKASWGSSAAQPFALDKWAAELARLAAKYPEATVDRIYTFRNLAGIITRYARADSLYGAATLTSFRASANVSLRRFINADRVFSEAQRTPMQIRFTALDGRVVDLAALRGKVVLLDFGAYTWCGACRANEPIIQAAYRKYHDLGFEVISFALELSPKDRAFVEDRIRRHGYSWPHYFDGKGFDNEYVRRFGFSDVPQMFLLDQNGLLVSTHANGKYLDPLVRKALQLPPLENAQLLSTPEYARLNSRMDPVPIDAK